MVRHQRLFGGANIHSVWRLQALGFGGRDNVIHAHEQYTELKTIWIDLNG